jgi:hypothetical protein
VDGPRSVHVAWQSCAVVFLSAVELVLFWLTVPRLGGRFYLAAVLAALSPMGFLTAFLSRKFFAGTLSDSNGTPPVRLKNFGAVRSIDMNLTAVISALFSLFAILAVYRA